MDARHSDASPSTSAFLCSAELEPESGIKHLNLLISEAKDAESKDKHWGKDGITS